MGLGIQALELRRYKGRKRTFQMKEFRKYLKNTERYILPENIKEKEENINKIFLRLKNGMKKRKYKTSLMLISKLYNSVEKIYKERYPNSRLNFSSEC